MNFLIVSVINIVNEKHFDVFVFIYMYYIVSLSDCNNISTHCKTYANSRNCLKRGWVRKRCQRACGLCSKYFQCFILLQWYFYSSAVHDCHWNLRTVRFSYRMWNVELEYALYWRCRCIQQMFTPCN